MTTFQIVQLIIHAKNKKNVIRILKKYRISASKSKYC